MHCAFARCRCPRANQDGTGRINHDSVDENPQIDQTARPHTHLALLAPPHHPSFNNNVFFPRSIMHTRRIAALSCSLLCGFLTCFAK